MLHFKLDIMRSLLLLLSLAVIACGTDEPGKILNQVKAGQQSGMTVTNVGDTIYYVGNQNSYTIDVFGDKSQEIKIQLIPYNVITCVDPKALLISNTVEFDRLNQLYHPFKDSIVTTPQWDPNQNMYLSQVNVAWSCNDPVNGSPVNYTTLSLWDDHTSSLSSNWMKLNNGQENLLPEGGLNLPYSRTIQDTIYKIYDSKNPPNCGATFHGNERAYFMFKATKASEDYIGWILVRKEFGVSDYVYIDSWAISEEPIQN